MGSWLIQLRRIHLRGWRSRAAGARVGGRRDHDRDGAGGGDAAAHGIAQRPVRLAAGSGRRARRADRGAAGRRGSPRRPPGRLAESGVRGRRRGPARGPAVGSRRAHPAAGAAGRPERVAGADRSVARRGARRSGGRPGDAERVERGGRALLVGRLRAPGQRRSIAIGWSQRSRRRSGIGPRSATRRRSYRRRS
jgi:hypothetical protein